MKTTLQYAPKQSGFALATVLILLFILAGFVAVMLDGQRAKILQADVAIQSAQVRQESHNAHRACVDSVRSALAADSTAKVVTWWKIAGDFVAADDSRWADAAKFLDGACLIEVATDEKEVTAGSWTPKVRITSKFSGEQGVVMEQTEWRYPTCSASASSDCLSLNAEISLKDSTTVLRPRYRANQPVLVANRVY